MNGIEFRAIRKEGNPLVYYFTLEQLTQGKGRLWFNDYYWDQWTGHYDIHEKRIYKSDIIKVSPKYFMDIWKVARGEYVSEVWWDKELAAYLLGNVTEHIIFRNDFARKYFEVIGTIHENPELIKKNPSEFE